MTHKTLSNRVILSAILMACAVSVTALTPALHHTRAAAIAPTDDCPTDCQRELARARAATAKYHTESSAFADGFISTVQCVAAPGVGAMGVHYINLSRMMNLDVDVTEPETLLYARQPDGSMRLIGLEYYAPVISNGSLWFGDENTPPPAVDNPAPVLFGRAFDGPMAGHEPGQPWHYDMHVWVWRDNPLGMFFPFNPTVSCQ